MRFDSTEESVAFIKKLDTAIVEAHGEFTRVGYMKAAKACKVLRLTLKELLKEYWPPQ